MKRLLFILTICFLSLPVRVGAFTETHMVCTDGNGAGGTNGDGWANCFDGFSDIAWDGEIEDSDDGEVGPNDKLELRDDDGIYRETLTAGSSGLSGLPITIGIESGDTPIISGADLMTTWEVHAGNIWKKTGVTTEPMIVIFDGTWGEWETDEVASLDTEKEWWWDTATDILYVYTTGGDPDTQWPSGIDVAQRDSTVVISSKDYITVDGLTLRNANRWSVVMNTVDNAIINNCTVSNCGEVCVFGNTLTNSTVFNCTMIRSGGITTYDSDNNIFENNEMRDSRSTARGPGGGGILLYSSDSNIVRYNYCHDARLVGADREGDGMHIGNSYDPAGYSDDNEVYGNIISKFNDGMNIGGDGNKIYNNTFYKNHWPQYHIGNTAATDNNIVKNNIFYDGITNNYLVAGLECGINNTIDYNCYYDPDNPSPSVGNVLTWTITGSEAWGPITWDAWVAHAKYDQNSIYADPLMTNPGAGDFTLQPNSPARHGAAHLVGYEARWRPESPLPPNAVTTMIDILSIGAYGVYRGSAGM